MQRYFLLYAYGVLIAFAKSLQMMSNSITGAIFLSFYLSILKKICKCLMRLAKWYILILSCSRVQISLVKAINYKTKWNSNQESDGKSHLWKGTFLPFVTLIMIISYLHLHTQITYVHMSIKCTSTNWWWKLHSYLYIGIAKQSCIYMDMREPMMKHAYTTI